MRAVPVEISVGWMNHVSRRLRILVVCTANVCRSPLAQYTLKRSFSEFPPLVDTVVLSAGTAVREGSVICATSSAFIEEDRDLAASQRAHQLTPELVIESDLILTMELEQRSIVTRLVPGSQMESFTLKEATHLAELLLDDGAAASGLPLEALSSELHAKRGHAALSTPLHRRRRSLNGGDLTFEDGHELRARRHRQALRETHDTTLELASIFKRLT